MIQERAINQTNETTNQCLATNNSALKHEQFHYHTR